MGPVAAQRGLLGALLGALLVALLLVATLVTGCSGVGGGPAPTTSSAGDAPAEPSTSISTLTPISLPPPPPPSGDLLADMRQSSLDAARAQMQVWVDNDTAALVRPRRIVYRDPRLPRPVRAQRLRAIPSQAERGFVLPLPADPACGTARGATSLRVTFRSRAEPGRVLHRVLPVADETDVVGRYLGTRCQEIAVARVARLRWADRVPYDGQLGHPARLLLRIDPVGSPADTLRIDTVAGTPMLGAVGAAYWSPSVTVHGDDPPSTLSLPLQPSRCDDHIFMEGGGSTAFRLTLSVDGRPGQLVLRMSPRGAATRSSSSAPRVVSERSVAPQTPLIRMPEWVL